VSISFKMLLRGRFCVFVAPAARCRPPVSNNCLCVRASDHPVLVLLISLSVYSCHYIILIQNFVAFPLLPILTMFAAAAVAALALGAPCVSASQRNELDYSFEAGEVVKTPLPHTYIKASDLPEALDYRTQGWLTTDLNQHIPVYCGSW
jgi:hypothetical protein